MQCPAQAVLMSGSGSTVFCLGEPTGGAEAFQDCPIPGMKQPGLAEAEVRLLNPKKYYIHFEVGFYIRFPVKLAPVFGVGLCVCPTLCMCDMIPYPAIQTLQVVDLLTVDLQYLPLPLSKRLCLETREPSKLVDFPLNIDHFGGIWEFSSVKHLHISHIMFM